MTPEPVYHIAADGTRDRCLRHWPCPACDGGIEERRCRICELIDPTSPSYSPGMRRLYHPEEFPADPTPQPINGRLPSGHAVGGVRDESQSVPAHLRPSRSAGPAPHHRLLAGDLVERLAKKVGADRAARWLERRTGKPCGCAQRREALNRADSVARRLLGWRSK